jgi:hypothetical protein
MHGKEKHLVNFERFTTFSRTGVSVRISAGEYKIVEPGEAQRAFFLVCTLLPLLLLELFAPEEYDGVYVE